MSRENDLLEELEKIDLNSEKAVIKLKATEVKALSFIAINLKDIVTELREIKPKIG